MYSIGEIIAKNRKKKGYSQQKLVHLLSLQGINVTTKALSKWETNAREPGLHVFLTLCRILDIEDVYDAYFGENPYSILDGLNDEGKDKVIDYAKILKASRLFEPHKCEILPFRSMPHYDMEPVSAGTGDFLTDALSDMVEFPAALAPEAADFTVRISGDSMEPKYHNNDIAFIQKRESISSGEIGIFSLNGSAFIKKLYDEPDGLYLISLNEKYDPIPIREGDSFKIFGKVVGSCSRSEVPALSH